MLNTWRRRVRLGAALLFAGHAMTACAADPCTEFAIEMAACLDAHCPDGPPGLCACWAEGRELDHQSCACVEVDHAEECRSVGRSSELYQPGTLACDAFVLELAALETAACAAP